MTFSFDDADIPFTPPMTVAAALWSSGRRTWRVSARNESPRGYYCGDGFCYDCLVTVDGTSNQRACQVAAEAGMRVQTQIGFGTL